MFCVHCGQKIVEREKFCPSCGKSVVKPIEQESQEKEENPTVSVSEDKPSAWIVYGISDIGDHFYDKNNIKKIRTNVITVYDKVILSEEGKKYEIKYCEDNELNNDRLDELYSTISILEINCRNHTVKTNKIIYCNEQGKILNEEILRDSETEEIENESIVYTLFTTLYPTSEPIQDGPSKEKQKNIKNNKPHSSSFNWIYGLLIVVIFIVIRCTLDNKKESAISDRKVNEPQIVSEQQKEQLLSAPFLDYQSVARYPDDCKGKYVKLYGQVAQVMEDGDGVTMRINTKEERVGWYDDTVLVEYKKLSNEGRILEKDMIRVYGICKGITTYKAIMGNKVSIPLIDAKIVNLEK